MQDNPEKFWEALIPLLYASANIGVYLYEDDRYPDKAEIMVQVRQLMPRELAIRIAADISKRTDELRKANPRIKKRVTGGELITPKGN